MANVLFEKYQSFKNKPLQSFEFEIERCKIKELALALGETNEQFLNGEIVPLTFSTLLDFWSDAQSAVQFLKLNPKKVLHGEQSYEYFKQFRVGDRIRVTGCIEEIIAKEKMNLFIVKKEYVNQHDELIVIAKATIIEQL